MSVFVYSLCELIACSCCWTFCGFFVFLFLLICQFYLDFSGGASGKETKEMWVQSLGWEDPWRRKWQPTPILSGESHGQRSLAGCNW